MRGGACVFTIIALAMNLLHTNGYDYCANETEAKLCPNGKRHIMCEAWTLVPQASFMSILPMTNSWRHFMLEEINNIRNVIANGAVAQNNEKFPKAARLRELIWDWELAYLASTHANRCCNWRDYCRNTVRFPDVGQLANYRGAREPIETKAVVKRIFNGTFNEKRHVNDPVNFVKTFHRQYASGIDCEWLALAINERASRIGCGAAYCDFCDKNRYCFYLTCNLDAAIRKNDQIYTISEGDTASDCSHWNTDKSSDYEHLCANSGEIFG